MRRQTPLNSRINELASLKIQLACESFLTDFDNVQACMIKGVNQILDGEATTLTLLDETNDEWLICKSTGSDFEWTYQLIPREGKGLIKECLESGQSVCVNDIPNDPRFDPSSDGLDHIKIHSLLCVPLSVNKQVVGVLRVLNKRHGDFDNLDQLFLSLIAYQAADAFYSTRLANELKTIKAELETSRKNLMSSNNFIRALSENLHDSFYVIDPQFRLIAVNRSRAGWINQTSKLLVGQLCYEAFFNRNSPCAECRVLETFRNNQNTKRNESRLNIQEDISEWEIYSYPILDENDDVTFAILLEEDVTENRHLETILMQSEKLAAVGQLAAGVAHEINNPLTAIIANAQILHRSLPPDHDMQESVDLIARAGARAAQVVRNLLDFARKEEYRLGLTDLNETVERALELIQHEFIARAISLEFKADPNLPSILASQDHLQSIWLNLLLNAMDSLDKIPGEIKVDTQHVGDEIHVSVTDNGKGIPPENLTRIFDPFYTTKAPGRGTGLGLSVVRAILELHGNTFGVENEESGVSFWFEIDKADEL